MHPNADVATTINMPDVVREVAARLPKDVTQEQTKAVLAMALDVIEEAVQSGNRVMLYRFGQFLRVRRKPRKGRHPRTGRTMDIPEMLDMAFVPSRKLRARIRAIGEEEANAQP